MVYSNLGPIGGTKAIVLRFNELDFSSERDLVVIQCVRRGECLMKRALILSLMVIFSLFAVNSVFAGGKCPQPRKTKPALGSIAKKDKTETADSANGKKLYHKAAKPMACKMCHGDKGDGGGKLGKALKPKPRNFTCSETMKNVSAGQMFHIIKNGSPGTGMAAHGKTLQDKEIWDVIKYIRSTFIK